ncbi:hypothetical protein GALMADRAFT_1261465 [Galerina marginata CBS 339.88]|uniref:Uncharacterized protein n=1 Tax=Galerina marginata (strain CBS 339.88) TaxID=685588 RepID=A0A067T8H1_GALM3|nr:hypothetical protein GALMADRAFT_1261465 [Galerina marginata CBS 339.88]
MVLAPQAPKRPFSFRIAVGTVMSGVHPFNHGLAALSVHSFSDLTASKTRPQGFPQISMNANTVRSSRHQQLQPHQPRPQAMPAPTSTTRTHRLLINKPNCMQVCESWRSIPTSPRGTAQRFTTAFAIGHRGRHHLSSVTSRSLTLPSMSIKVGMGTLTVHNPHSPPAR